MILKEKSLIVALVSGFIISAVLVFTLIGYLAYIELKGEESRRAYRELFRKIHTGRAP